MKIFYIAGPYRGATPWDVRQNIEHAARFAAEVWRAGHVALCPHLNSAHMEGVTGDENFLAGTLELLYRCDGIILIPGWRKSTGAKAEATQAQARSLKIAEVLHPSEIKAAIEGMLEDDED